MVIYPPHDREVEGSLYMNIYFADRNFNILGMASTGLPGKEITQDVRTDEVGAAHVELKIELTHAPEDFWTVREWAKGGNYVFRGDVREDATVAAELYNIMMNESDTGPDTCLFYAYSPGFELNNRTTIDYSSSIARTIEDYIINIFGNGSDMYGFEVGVNEIPTRSRKLSWEGGTTLSERMVSLANGFDAEISYRYIIDGLKVTKKLIDIYKRRGRDDPWDLRVGREVKRIIIKENVSEVCTALRVKGGIPEGGTEAITLEGYAYDDGDFYVHNNALISRTANAMWGQSGQQIYRNWSYDTTSQATLCSKAKAKLKKLREPVKEYEVELYYTPPGLTAGTPVRVIDTVRGIYLTARLMRLEESVTDRNNVAYVDEYKEETEE